MPSDIRLRQLKSRHQIVSADLAAIVERAAARRLSTQALQIETQALIHELRRQCDRAEEVHAAWSQRRAEGHRRAV